FAAGLLPFVYLVVRSRMAPSISFYGPIESFEQFLFFVLRKGYAGSDVSTTASSADRVQYAWLLFRELARQFTIVGAALAGVGLVASWRRLGAAMAAGLVAMFLGASVVLLC